MDWRRNKVRDLFSKGYSQLEISDMLHIYQSTVSRDVNYMQSKINKKMSISMSDYSMNMRRWC